TSLLGLCAAMPGSLAADPVTAANATVLGPNVYVFDPSMPAAEIQRAASDVFKKMEAHQFGPERIALFVKPGTYDVTLNVGVYRHVAGLGRRPGDVQIRGGVHVSAKWMRNGNAAGNFWGTVETFAVTPSSNSGVSREAVLQAAPLRRLHAK